MGATDINNTLLLIAAIATPITSIVTGITAYLLNRNSRAVKDASRLSKDVAELRLEMEEVLMHVVHIRRIARVAGLDLPDVPKAIEKYIPNHMREVEGTDSE